MSDFNPEEQIKILREAIANLQQQTPGRLTTSQRIAEQLHRFLCRKDHALLNPNNGCNWLRTNWDTNEYGYTHGIRRGYHMRAEELLKAVLREEKTADDIILKVISRWAQS